MTEYAPVIIERIETRLGRAEIVEWHWPSLFDFVRCEDRLMVEMSIPPTSGDASACFPDYDPERRCFLGSLFTRWPGVTIGGRAEGGHIRVVRCVFSDDETRRLVGLRAKPDLRFLQSMLSHGSTQLRTLLNLVRRELENVADRSAAAVAALMELVSVEMERIIRRSTEISTSGRLAPWQFRRIRERLAMAGPTPAVSELAALCGISVRHLHRQFHALTGRTVADFVETTRIEQAKKMLEGQAYPIKAVAQACGFAHTNSFTRAFRRSTGQTPLTFRQASGAQPSCLERIENG